MVVSAQDDPYNAGLSCGWAGIQHERVSLVTVTKRSLGGDRVRVALMVCFNELIA